MAGFCVRQNMLMHAIFSPALRSWRRGLALAICGWAALADSSGQVAGTWTAISSSLVERLTNNGVKAAWPGGCSGVAGKRTNGEVCIKVIVVGLLPSSGKGKNWQGH